MDSEQAKHGLSAKQKGIILKTVAYMCRWSFSENFVEAKIFVWKFSVIERKHRTSSEKVFSVLSKAHFNCTVQQFEKKVIKVNFTFCGFFRTLCVFFCSERKVSQGFQNHKLGIQRKNLGRIFLTQMLFRHIFSFWAEKLGFSARIYRHGCQNCKIRTFRKFWGKTVFFKIELQTCSHFEMKKNRALVLKNFSAGFLQQEIALPENYFEEKWFLFRRKFVFLLSFLEFEWFACLSCKILQSGVSNQQSTRREKKIGEINLPKTCFFINKKSIWDFEQ